jgi:pyruvate dehydrogenase E2 component (dihydrolipoamide acetyltransferase)
VIGEPGEEFEIPETDGDEADDSAPEPVAEPAQAEQASVEPATAMSVGMPEDGARIKASPVARNIAKAKNVDLRMVTGTGPGGRIVKRDVEAALASPQASATPAFVAVSREDNRVPMSRLRQAIGRRLSETNREVPQFFVTHEYDMDALMKMRKDTNAVLPEGEKLSVNDFIVKGVALALREFPNLNAVLDGDSIVQRGAINVGNAVAVEGGLLTVVCKNADQKTLRQISLEVREMASNVRAGKISPEDIEGSTFSISNLGMFDVDQFVAIINPPEAAILALGSAKQVPVVVDGELSTGWRMKATISVDHRISDGAEAAQFLQALARYLENPLLLAV